MSDSVRPHRWEPARLPRPWDSPSKNTEVGCHFLPQCIKVKSESEVTQLCLTLSDPMDCSLPGSSIHGIFQARVLEWVTSAFSVKWLQPLYITLQQFLKRTSLQFSVNPQFPSYINTQRHMNTHMHMPVHKYSEHHCSEEPKGENSNVHQQMKAKCAGS